MPHPRSKDTELILGYRLTERLGSGGFGEVWKAEAPGGLLKAIKFVYGELSDRQASREIKALERIKEVRHPFVLSLERAEVVDGRLLIVSELADKTLLDRFQECRAAGENGLARGELLSYLRDAAEALDFITARFGLQHLDIKPSNLFLIGGRLKVGDFGLVRDVCRQSDASAGGLSPAYAAPECFAGEVSLFADQYGLAIVYQEMLTGKRPFAGATTLQLAEQHLRARPNLAHLSEEEQRVIGRALSKNPRDRFPTCGEMVQALLAIAVHQSPAAECPEPAAVLPEPAAESPPPDVFRSMGVAEAGLDAPNVVTVQTCPSSGSEQQTGSSGSWLATDLLDGLPEPTLFIGIGGIAGRVLRQIKWLFETRYELLRTKLPLGWLLLDTDRAALQEVCRASAVAALQPEETVLMPLHGPGQYHPRIKEFIGWLDRHWIYRIPRTHCTEGMRPLGRLALLDNAPDVLNRLRQAIQQVNRPTSEPSSAGRLRVVVIAGIGGGTGGGCLADVAAAVRGILRDEPLEMTRLEAAVILASSVREEQNELARANAHITLKELSYVLDPDRRIPAVRALGVGPVEGGEPLFDRVDVAEFGEIVSQEDIETGSHLLAEYVYLNHGTPYGRALASRRPEPEGAAAGAQVRSFRLARLGFPRSELRRLVAREVCRRLIERWLHGGPGPAAEEATPAFRLVTNSVVAQVELPQVAAERFFTQLDLGEGRFHELFLERVERASGSNLPKASERRTHELLQARSRAEASQMIARFLEDQDEHFGPASDEDPGPAAATPFEQKLRNEFKRDSHDQQQQLEAWVRRIVEDPARRLKPAAEALNHFIGKLVGEIQATPERTKSIRARAREIQRRLLASGVGTGAKQRVSSLLKTHQRELSLQADELSRSGQLRIEETALRVRAEVVTALLAGASRASEELARLHQGLEKVKHLFEPDAPRLRNSERESLGFSIDLLPMEPPVGVAIGGALADVLCSDRRLAHLERRFQEEVLDVHGGFAVVMGRPPGPLAEFFQGTLLPRVAGAVGDWLEGQDAAELLRQRYGSIDRAVNEVLRRWQSAQFGNPHGAREGLVVATPGNPSGRSLRECLARSADGLRIAQFVTVPEDVVFCLELEDLSLPALAADLVSGQAWLAGLASKLVTRNDVDWPGLDPAGCRRDVVPGS
jgi:eukaryotic-like serine/threonine-protein kinase